jgi:phospholipid/cholesterol/gamma-HCH transport system ATP-binding protein
MPSDAQNPVLRFDHVSVSFDDVPALVDLSFQAFEGESRIILGAAGSGKTVLLKTALGLQRPDSGAVYVFGQDISRLSERELFAVRGKIGMLFQESALFDSLSIEENVAYPLQYQASIHCAKSEVRPRVEEALKFVELEGTLEKFPSELSGGMRRRAAIARAVVSGPPLLLYDSPTAGLDPITANTIMALIVKERDLNKTTTLLVTYRYQDGNLVANFRYNPDNGRLERAEKIDGRPASRTVFMVLREGSLIFEGPQDELEASEEPYVSKFVKRRE